MNMESSRPHYSLHQQWQLDSLRHLHQYHHYRGTLLDYTKEASINEHEAATRSPAYSHVSAPATMTSVPPQTVAGSSGHRTPALPEDRKDTAQVSELGPRLAGYLEMNPLFVVRRDEYGAAGGPAGAGIRPSQSPEVTVIPLSPDSAPSPPPHTGHRRLSCCRSQRKLFLVPLLVLASVVVFIITMYRNNCPATQTLYGRCLLSGLKRFSFQPLAQNPLLGPSSQTLLDMGALESSLVTTGNQGWRLITCIWLHAGIFHLLLNMLGLLSLGLQMENEFGFVKVGLIYLLSGFGGSLLSALFLRLAISVGASGALFGLMGALLSELLINWSQHERNWFMLSQLLVLIIINFALGKMPHVDNYAHMGGCIAGFLLGFVLLQRPRLSWTPDPAPAASTIPAPGFPVSPTAPGRPHHTDFDPRLLQFEPQYQQQQQLQYQQMYHYQQQFHEQVPRRPTRLTSFSFSRFVVWVLALNLLVVLYVVALIMLFRGVDVRKKCKWCRQLF